MTTNELNAWAKDYMQNGRLAAEALHPNDGEGIVNVFHAYASTAAAAFKAKTGEDPPPGNDFWIAVYRWFVAPRHVLFSDYMPPIAEPQAVPGQPIPEDMDPEEPT